jgi:hypothetical protein
MPSSGLCASRIKSTLLRIGLGVTCHTHPDAVGSALFGMMAQRRLQAAADARLLGNELRSMLTLDEILPGLRCWRIEHR